jgi:hypothetical protein
MGDERAVRRFAEDRRGGGRETRLGGFGWTEAIERIKGTWRNEVIERIDGVERIGDIRLSW